MSFDEFGPGAMTEMDQEIKEAGYVKDDETEEPTEKMEASTEDSQEEASEADEEPTEKMEAPAA